MKILPVAPALPRVEDAKPNYNKRVRTNPTLDLAEFAMQI